MRKERRLPLSRWACGGSAPNEARQRRQYHCPSRRSRVTSARGSPRACGPTLLPLGPPSGWRPPRSGPRAG
eukprot:15483609-Alexandrium_andersonii.AAC.1